MPGFKIRKARSTDIAAVMAFARSVPELEASTQTRFVEHAELEEWLACRVDIVLVAIENDKVIGFLNAMLLSRLWCYLDNIAVHPDYRKRGVAKALLNRLYRTLEQRNIHYISGLVGAKHARTRAYWKKQGFCEGKEFVWIEKEF